MAEEDKATPTPTGDTAPAKPRDYQTQLYQSLIELGASNPDALLTASGDYWKHCQSLSIAPQVTAALIYGAERHRHEVTRTTINEARENLGIVEESDPSPFMRRDALTSARAYFKQYSQALADGDDLHAQEFRGYILAALLRKDGSIPTWLEARTLIEGIDPATIHAEEAPKAAYRYADISFDRLDDAQRFAKLLEKQASNIGVFVGGTKHGATVTTNAAPEVIAKVLKKHRWKGGWTMTEAAKLAAEAQPVDAFSIVRRHERPSGLVFVPDVVREMMEARGWTVAQAHQSLLQMHRSGLIELRPESGMGRVSDEDLKLALPGPQGSKLTWIRIRTEAEEKLSPQPEAATAKECTKCIPWIKVARDPKVHADFAELAKKFGPIKTPRDVYAVVGDDLNKETAEVFLVLALNIHSELMAPPYEVARGQRDRVAVGIDNVMDAASDARCAAYCVVHNHPGDTPEPSATDIKLTREIREATPPGRVFVDHLVVGVKTIYSITHRKLVKIK